MTAHAAAGAHAGLIENDRLVSAETDVETRAYGKIFWRIMPFLMLCYTVSYLDRVNVGFAKLQMAGDIGLSNAAFGFGAGVFFIGYFIFELPSNLIMHKVGARIWIARIMISWGIISGCMMFVSSVPSFYIMRFLLGAAEAGFYPGMILYMTYWFPSYRRARVVCVFMAAIPVSAIFGNPLSGFVMDHLNGFHGLAGWKWMFVAEAIPALIIGVITPFYLQNNVADAKWLNAEEKAIVAAKIAAETATKKAGSPSEIWSVLRSPRVWQMCLIYFCFVLGQYGLNFWMPTLIKAAGIKGNFHIGLVSAIPYIVTLAVMLSLGLSGDRARERRWHLALPALISAVGFVVAATSGNFYLSLLALSVAAAGTISCSPMFWPLPTAFLAEVGAAAGIAWINSVGNLAGFCGPYAVGYLKQVTGTNVAGLYLLAAALVLGAAVTLAVPKALVNR
jgi:MFS family permease